MYHDPGQSNCICMLMCYKSPPGLGLADRRSQGTNGGKKETIGPLPFHGGPPRTCRPNGAAIGNWWNRFQRCWLRSLWKCLPSWLFECLWSFVERCLQCASFFPSFLLPSFPSFLFGCVPEAPTDFSIYRFSGFLVFNCQILKGKKKKISDLTRFLSANLCSGRFDFSKTRKI